MYSGKPELNELRHAELQKSCVPLGAHGMCPNRVRSVEYSALLSLFSFQTVQEKADAHEQTCKAGCWLSSVVDKRQQVTSGWAFAVLARNAATLNELQLARGTLAFLLGSLRNSGCNALRFWGRFSLPAPQADFTELPGPATRARASAEGQLGRIWHAPSCC